MVHPVSLRRFRHPLRGRGDLGRMADFLAIGRLVERTARRAVPHPHLLFAGGPLSLAADLSVGPVCGVSLGRLGTRLLAVLAWDGLRGGIGPLYALPGRFCTSPG